MKIQNPRIEFQHYPARVGIGRPPSNHCSVPGEARLDAQHHHYHPLTSLDTVKPSITTPFISYLVILLSSRFSQAVTSAHMGVCNLTY
jgi:hypothetical protein